MSKEETATANKNEEFQEEYKKEFETLDYLCLDCPIYLGMLDRVGFQVKNLCKNYKNKEEAKSMINDIESHPDKYKNEPKWKYYSLGDLFTADYKFLVEKNIINQKLVPNEEFFHSRFYYKNIPDMVYPLTTQQYYLILLKKEIGFLIDEYFGEE